jgi:hypothetical protein
MLIPRLTTKEKKLKSVGQEKFGSKKFSIFNEQLC